MKRLGLCLVAFCLAGVLQAQEPAPGSSGAPGEAADEWDIDSLFGEPLPDSGGAGESAAGLPDTGGTGETGLAGMIRKRGLVLDAAYFFYGGVSPGWDEAPWYWNDTDETYSTLPGAGISSALGLDFQISERLRVKNLFTFALPDLAFTVKEVFVDYNLLDRVFLRGGKFTQRWGVSPNYPNADLLSRLPPNNSGGDPYTVKADVPIGAGGLELLAMTRPGFFGNAALPEVAGIGFGGKYNLAYPWADIEAGIFYHWEMPLRNFLSVKSAVLNTDLYAEGMVSVCHNPWGTVQGAGAAGFVRNFFSGKLIVNGEYSYNGEEDARYFIAETKLEAAEVSSFAYGHNVAVNVLYRTGFFWDLRIMVQCLYSITENSARLVPGLSMAPFPHIGISLGVPMALGSRDGVYYRRNADRNNRPFSMVLLVSISGDYRSGYAP
ncbi:MAG: hypothetical protein LBK27_04240 [Treponema sp.]|nr:hypothetical protein [Treponema sp.]